MKIHPGIIEELVMQFDQLNNVLIIANPDEIPSREQWDRLRSLMFRKPRTHSSSSLTADALIEKSAVEPICP
jgi:hypothetical protein